MDDWKGVRFAEFVSTPELRLRGRLRLYFLSLLELENPDGIADEHERDWAYSVLERVSRGYETMHDATKGQLRRILSSTIATAAYRLPAARKQVMEAINPIQFFKQDHPHYKKSG